MRGCFCEMRPLIVSWAVWITVVSTVVQVLSQLCLIRVAVSTLFSTVSQQWFKSCLSSVSTWLMLCVLNILQVCVPQRCLSCVSTFVLNLSHLCLICVSSVSGICIKLWQAPWEYENMCNENVGNGQISCSDEIICGSDNFGNCVCSWGVLGRLPGRVRISAMGISAVVRFLAAMGISAVVRCSA